MSAVIVRNVGVTVVKNSNVVKVQTFPLTVQVLVGSIVTFSLTAASDGQTVFTLPSAAKPSGLVMAAINGAVQDQSAGDFTVSGSTLTLNAGVNAGDKIYGFYEVAI